MNAQEIIDQNFLTVEETVELLEASERSVHRWCKEGKLDAVRIGSTRRSVWLIHKDEEGKPIFLGDGE